jgi:hypothetical protein
MTAVKFFDLMTNWVAVLLRRIEEMLYGNDYFLTADRI